MSSTAVYRTSSPQVLWLRLVGCKEGVWDRECVVVVGEVEAAQPRNPKVKSDGWEMPCFHLDRTRRQSTELLPLDLQGPGRDVQCSFVKSLAVGSCTVQYRLCRGAARERIFVYAADLPSKLRANDSVSPIHRAVLNQTNHVPGATFWAARLLGRAGCRLHMLPWPPPYVGRSQPWW